jgi:hypothetical protein
METTNPILGNPLLIAAILLFLAILPRALRQRKKTALDKAIERFEKEESQAEESPDKNLDTQKKPIALKDGSLVYLKNDLSSSQKIWKPGGIPPFPIREDEKVKIVKPGVPISHLETAEPPAKKKVKLIKQEFSIAPDPNKVNPQKDLSAPRKDKENKSLSEDKKPSFSEDFPAPPPVSDNVESKDSWIEAEIPGLTIEPPVEEKNEDIPIFNASPKEEYKSEDASPPVSASKEKQGMGVKKLAPKTEEKKDVDPEKQVAIEADSADLEMEISDSELKEVEIKSSVLSHKSIAKKEADIEESPSEIGEAEKSVIALASAPSERNDLKTSPDVTKPKPFLLDVRYLAPEESETENSVSVDKHTAEMADATIARLNALRIGLESQFDKFVRKDRNQNSLPDFKESSNGLSDKKEVSLEELDSFLFTATQRKNEE